MSAMGILQQSGMHAAFHLGKSVKVCYVKPNQSQSPHSIRRRLLEIRGSRSRQRQAPYLTPSQYSGAPEPLPTSRLQPKRRASSACGRCSWKYPTRYQRTATAIRYRTVPTLIARSSENFPERWEHLCCSKSLGRARWLSAVWQTVGYDSLGSMRTYPAHSVGPES